MYGFVIVSVQLKCYNNTIVIVLYEEYVIKGYFVLYFLKKIFIDLYVNYNENQTNILFRNF